MLSLLIWWVAIGMEAGLVFRALSTKLTTKFPLFYTYLSIVLLQEFLRFGVYRSGTHAQYSAVYWPTQFVSLVAGSAVLFEIYRISMREFPGAAKMARNLLGALFAGIFVNAFWSGSLGSAEWLKSTCLVLERDMRAVQAAAICTLVVLFLVYSIPFGKNLRGILVGYSIFVAASAIQLALVAHFGAPVKPIWVYAQPITYLAVLGIWIQALWREAAVPKTVPAPALERDYETLVANTNEMLDRARTRLGWVART
jgi:hypothetical protein